MTTRFLCKCQVKSVLLQFNHWTRFVVAGFLIASLAIIIPLLIRFLPDLIRWTYGYKKFDLTVTATAVTAIGGLISIVFALKAVWLPISKSVFYSTKIQNFRTEPKIQDEVFNKFKILTEWLKKKRNLKNKGKSKCPERMVIFIDDIDRCQPNKITQILEAIKMFINYENFVFILAMDAQVVRMAVGQQYKFISKDVERWGRFYLEKIIQVPFALPVLDAELLKNMKNKLIKNFIEAEKVDIRDSNQNEYEGKTKTTDALSPDSDNYLTSESQKRTTNNENNKTTKIGDEPQQFPVIKSESQTELNDQLELKITREEDEWINQFLNDVDDLSPRLLIRFINVYLIAKHIYIVKKGYNPPTEFLYWLAFSVKYPFEIKDMKNMILKSVGIFNNWEHVCNELVKNYTESNKLPNDTIRNNILNIKMTIGRKITNHNIIKDFYEITDLFNLVLD
ncbi:MAG: P-loop NTPase fold protein [Candidatus Zixiibacteriota bacterium]